MNKETSTTMFSMDMNTADKKREKNIEMTVKISGILFALTVFLSIMNYMGLRSHDKMTIWEAAFISGCILLGGMLLCGLLISIRVYSEKFIYNPQYKTEYISMLISLIIILSLTMTMILMCLLYVNFKSVLPV